MVISGHSDHQNLDSALMATMNLKEYAQSQGISESTARRWFAAGTLPHPARKTGRLILVEVPDTAQSNFPPRTAAYVCVTSSKDLEKRVRTVHRWCAAHGLAVDAVAADEDGSHRGRTTQYGSPAGSETISGAMLNDGVRDVSHVRGSRRAGVRHGRVPGRTRQCRRPIA